MVWKDLVKHSPLYNTHRKDQKTPEPHPASPPLLQGRAPAAIAETSFLLQHSLHVNYRKILYSFNIDFNSCRWQQQSANQQRPHPKHKKHNGQKASNEKNHPAAAATSPAVPPLLATWSLPTNNCHEHQCGGNMQPTMNSFQDNPRVPENVSIQKLIVTLRWTYLHGTWKTKIITLITNHVKLTNIHPI